MTRAYYREVQEEIFVDDEWEFAEGTIVFDLAFCA
jgi:hypothetical protein